MKTYNYNSNIIQYYVFNFYLLLVFLFLCIVMHFKGINLNTMSVRRFSLNFSSPIFLELKLILVPIAKIFCCYCFVNILNSYLSNDTKHFCIQYSHILFKTLKIQNFIVIFFVLFLCKLSPLVNFLCKLPPLC